MTALRAALLGFRDRTRRLRSPDDEAAFPWALAVGLAAFAAAVLIALHP
jgi:hypothetical protein